MTLREEGEAKVGRVSRDKGGTQVVLVRGKEEGAKVDEGGTEVVEVGPRVDKGGGGQIERR